MSDWMVLVLVVVIALLAWAAWAFNRLIALRARARASWADIDVQLKKRWDLVPRLVETVRAYAAHESATLEAVVRARESAEDAESAGAAERGLRESELASGMSRLVALVEAYPDLKADTIYASLHHDLVAVEDALQSARRYYNAVVRDLNTRVAQFPSNLVATLCAIRPMEYFEIDDPLERLAPRINMEQTRSRPANAKE